VFDKGKVKTALKNLFRHNFVEDFRNCVNTCRIYALNDDKGLVIATWPKQNSPKIPIPYQDETQNGYEYQAACHMIYEGLLDEGLSVVKAIRDRYAGWNRNPWNEFECGSNYARSMASFGLILALSGFEYDMISGHIAFSPKLNRDDFCSFWSLNRGWGQFISRNGDMDLVVKRGSITLRSFASDIIGDKQIAAVYAGGREIKAEQNGKRLQFAEPIHIDEGHCLRIVVE
jgi:non-lysosomal glucosylceramidase